MRKFSYTDQYSNEQRSSGNSFDVRDSIIADTTRDWDTLLQNLVREEFLVQSDADMLHRFWKEQIQVEERERQKLMRLGRPPKNTAEKLERLYVWINNASSNKIVLDYFLKLVVGSISFAVVYGFMNQIKFQSENFPYIFGFMAAIWAVTAMRYTAEENYQLWDAGIKCFAIIFLGYLAITLLGWLF